MEPCRRRRFRAGAIWLVSLLACSGGPPGDVRPNLLVIVSDDLRFDALGVVQREQGPQARFPWLATPNLDRLASEGVRFRNAFVVSALCSPSRASFLTGLYGHAVGVTDNQTALDPATPTYATLLRSAGYATGYAGKWHMGRQLERPGFDWSASYEQHGQYFDGSFLVNGSPRPSRGWVDDVTTDYAIGFLREHRSGPFLLVVGYKSPHGPRRPESVPERARDRHRGVETKLVSPPSGDSPVPWAIPGPRRHPPGTGPGAHVYLDLVAAMDDAIGRLLGELDALGLAERTIVVFAGDNGVMLGEHAIGSKRVAYEASIRIPLVVRWPAAGAALRGRQVDEMVLNVDLAPTLLELAGVAAPKGLHGRSLAPLLRGEPTPWRQGFLYEYFLEPGFSAPTHFAFRASDAKLIVYPGHPDWTELYDLHADPEERQSLAADPGRQDQLRALRAELLREARVLDLDPAQLEGAPPRRVGPADRSPSGAPRPAEAPR
jgi:arylsulfatase A-like enzyme